MKQNNVPSYIVATDYASVKIGTAAAADLKAIADAPIADLIADRANEIMVFPPAARGENGDLQNNIICQLKHDGTVLETNKTVGFISHGSTMLCINSSFSSGEGSSFFIHYMLQRINKLNIFPMPHTSSKDQIFDLLLYLFPLLLKKAVGKGLYKTYVRHSYNDARIKGAINVSRHIRLNTPFTGNIAYQTRTYDSDNAIMQLIRHTIEVLAGHSIGKLLLRADKDVADAVAAIRQATPSFSKATRAEVLNKNLRQVTHPYYSEYRPLQKLCVAILRHKHLSYGTDKNKTYGVLIDAAWLWEEYMAVVLKGVMEHCIKDRGPRYKLFTDGTQQIVPDFLSLKRGIVADAKYIHLDRGATYSEEKATAIYYKTITYMVRFNAVDGYLLYPIKDLDNMTRCIRNMHTIAEYNKAPELPSRRIIKLGVPIPAQAMSYTQFYYKMKAAEQELRMCLSRV